MNPKIADFGIAVNIKDEKKIPQSNQFSGTPAYRPPEVVSLRVGNDYDRRKWDIFSLSMIYFFMLKGTDPLIEFKTEDIIEQEIVQGTRPTLPVKVPNIIRSIIQKMWRDNYHERPTIQKICEEMRTWSGPIDRSSDNSSVDTQTSYGSTMKNMLQMQKLKENLL